MKPNKIQYITVSYNDGDYSMWIVRDHGRSSLYTLDSTAANHLHDRLTKLGYKSGLYYRFSGTHVTYQRIGLP